MMKVLLLIAGLFPLVIFAAEPAPDAEALMKKSGELAPDESLAQAQDLDAKRAATLNATPEKLAALLISAIKAKKGKVVHLEQTLSVTRKKGPGRVNFFSPDKMAVDEYTVTEPRFKESITFASTDVTLIKDHGYYPKCCKPDRILVVFENPAAVAAAKKAAEPVAAVRSERPQIVAPDGPFSVGGVNGPTAILELAEINGVALSIIEENLRKAKWLSPNEALKDRLRLDNDLAHQEIHATHQMLAEPMESLSSRVKPGVSRQLEHKGSKYKVRVDRRPPALTSAFGGEAPDDRWVTIVSQTSGAKIQYPKILEQLIWRYGFYSSPQSRYRIEPKKLAEFFPSLKK